MKHTKLKLTLTISVLMVVSFVIILLVFNIIMSGYIQDKSYRAIDQSMQYDADTEDIDTDSVLVNYLWVSPGYEFSAYKEGTYHYYYAVEDDIARWCANNKQPDGEILPVEIEGRSYYIAQKREADAINIFYVDITSEKDSIAIINILMLIVMALCASAAGFVGIQVGKQIEHDQEKQKEFFENASHELKTPLMAIQGYAEGFESGIIKDEKHVAKVIIDETNKMAKLVDEILCLSRIESGATKLQKEKIRVKDAINDCLVSIEGLAMKKKIQLEINVIDAIIEIDVVQFEKAITNILTNAVRHTDEVINVTFDGKKLIIWDDGKPISENDLENIFERFYTSKNGNTGIGLSLTKEIIEQHGWKIYAENMNAGTQFVIEI